MGLFVVSHLDSPSIPKVWVFARMLESYQCGRIRLEGGKKKGQKR